MTSYTELQDPTIKLPEPLLFEICSFLSKKELNNLAHTSKKWQGAVTKLRSHYTYRLINTYCSMFTGIDKHSIIKPAIKVANYKTFFKLDGLLTTLKAEIGKNKLLTYFTLWHQVNKHPARFQINKLTSSLNDVLKTNLNIHINKKPDIDPDERNNLIAEIEKILFRNLYQRTINLALSQQCKNLFVEIFDMTILWEHFLANTNRSLSKQNLFETRLDKFECYALISLIIAWEKTMTKSPEHLASMGELPKEDIITIKIQIEELLTCNHKMGKWLNKFLKCKTPTYQSLQELLNQLLALVKTIYPFTKNNLKTAQQLLGIYMEIFPVTTLCKHEIALEIICATVKLLWLGSEEKKLLGAIINTINQECHLNFVLENEKLQRVQNLASIVDEILSQQIDNHYINPRQTETYGTLLEMSKRSTTMAYANFYDLIEENHEQESSKCFQNN